jgi:hypothetical protein
MLTIRTNLIGRATTQYTNFNYTSLCVFNGVVLGTSSSGIAKLCSGNSDNGTKIEAYFIPVLTNFGDPRPKRLRHAYVSGGDSTGDLKFTVTGDEKTVSPEYTILRDPTEGQQRRRVTLGRGLSFTHGSFKFMNVMGSDFSIDSVHLDIEQKQHGIK